jgi:hypothetical protein
MNYSLIGILISTLFAGLIPAAGQDFYFDFGISRRVMDNRFQI